MRGWGQIALVGLLLWGCGGGAAVKQPETEPEPRRAGQDAPDRGTEGDINTGDPQAMDEIRAVFSRREPKVARCYSKRMEEKKLDQGEFIVKVAIRDGKAVKVDVTGKSWQDDEIQGCIEKLVGEWSFPETPEEVSFSYTYRFVPLT